MTNCKSKLLAKIRTLHYILFINLTKYNKQLHEQNETHLRVDWLIASSSYTYACTYVVSIENHRQKPCTMLTIEIIYAHIRAVQMLKRSNYMEETLRNSAKATWFPQFFREKTITFSRNSHDFWIWNWNIPRSDEQTRSSNPVNAG